MPFFAFCLTASFADDPSYDLGEQIGALQQKIEVAPSNKKGALKVSCAKLLAQDQKEYDAIKLFLEALRDLPTLPVTTTQEEKELFEKNLKIYFDEDTTTGERASILYKELEPVLKQHEDFCLLRYLFASSCANLNKLDAFFDHFAKSYQQNKECFLTHRSLGILHVKLFEKSADLEQRESEKAQALICFRKALEKEGRDTSLYKLLIFLAPAQQKKEACREVIDKIISGDVVIPRKDIEFYVQAALASDDKKSAKAFLDKACTWYQYSRTILQLRSGLDDDKDESSR